MDIQLVIVSLYCFGLRWGIWSGAQRKLERGSALADVVVAVMTPFFKVTVMPSPGLTCEASSSTWPSADCTTA